MKKYILLAVMLLVNINIFAQEQISNLVVPVSYFINHVSQLEKLKDNLNKYKQSSIVGISGMGKTQLARMYAYENKANYDIIWFIDCNLDIDGQLLKLAKNINDVYKKSLISEDVQTIEQETMNYLSSKNKWLLVFDNLKINENQKVKEFINWEHNGNILFCSQDSELLPNVVKMSVFNKTDSTLLAKNILESKNPTLIDFLIQEFQGYPILIVQGTQILNQVQGLNFEEYKKKIRASDDKIELNIKLAINELKPSAKKLLNQIALLNNQAFSKELLNSITEDKNSLDDDIYQLSKFALISNINPDEVNPIFEMHDIIAQKILKISGVQRNKAYLEEIINKIPKFKSLQAGHLWRTSKTIPENLEILLQNSERYKINTYSILDLRAELFAIYVNIQNIYEAERMINWLNNKDKKGEIQLWQMSKYQKYCYARYLGLIGIYHRMLLGNYRLAISDIIKALEIFDDLKMEGSIKYNLNAQRFNLNAHLAGSQASIGNIDIAEEIVKKMEVDFTQEVDNANIFILYYLKARLFLIEGKYSMSLEYIDKNIKFVTDNGLSINDLLLVEPYILKAEVLNTIGEYNESYVLSKQLYNMNKPNKKEDHQIFGRIFTQMSRAELGFGKVVEALEHARKAKTIFINDPIRPNKNIMVSPDIELAKAFVAEGDALAALNKNE